jgi:uncharacterized protein YaeQ
MALKSSIYKIRLNLSDLDRHKYQDFDLTIAQHPSETEERVMVRLIAFILNADDQLLFGKGLSTDDEPDLWLKSDSGEIQQWLDVGLPSFDRIKKACHRSDQVFVYCYGERTAPMWWKKIQPELERFSSLSVLYLPTQPLSELTAQLDRTLEMQATLSEGELSINVADQYITLTPEQWLSASDD